MIRVLIVKRIDNGFVVESLADGSTKCFQRIEDALQHIKDALILLDTDAQFLPERLR